MMVISKKARDMGMVYTTMEVQVQGPPVYTLENGLKTIDMAMVYWKISWKVNKYFTGGKLLFTVNQCYFRRYFISLLAHSAAI